MKVQNSVLEYVLLGVRFIVGPAFASAIDHFRLRRLYMKTAITTAASTSNAKTQVPLSHSSEKTKSVCLSGRDCS